MEEILSGLKSDITIAIHNFNKMKASLYHTRDLFNVLHPLVLKQMDPVD